MICVLREFFVDASVTQLWPFISFRFKEVLHRFTQIYVSFHWVSIYVCLKLVWSRRFYLCISTYFSDFYSPENIIFYTWKFNTAFLDCERIEKFYVDFTTMCFMFVCMYTYICMYVYSDLSMEGCHTLKFLIHVFIALYIYW